MLHVIDGKMLAQKIRQDLKREVALLDVNPRLAILLVGDDPASHLYVSLKKKAADEVGVQVDVHHLSADTPDRELIALLKTWNQDPAIHAILVQLPLPPGHDEDAVILAMDPKKDADGFHPANVRALLSGQATIIPPVHEGILRLINEAPVPINKATVTIIANSQIFATPLVQLLRTAGAVVKVMSPDELDREALSESDVVVIAIGRLNFLKADMTKPGAVIIDVGTNRAPDGKVRGDVDQASFTHQDVWLTPVPGGVGPMTIAQLLKNVVRLSL